MLEVGKQANQFFEPCVDTYGGKRHRLKSIDQYSQEKQTREQPSKKYFSATTLPDIINTYTFRKDAKPHEVERGKSLNSICYPLADRSRSCRNEQPESLCRLCARSAQPESDRAMVSPASKTASFHYWRADDQAIRSSLWSKTKSWHYSTFFTCIATFFRSQAALWWTTSCASAASYTDVSRCCFLQPTSQPSTVIHRAEFSQCSASSSNTYESLCRSSSASTAAALPTDSTSTSFLATAATTAFIFYATAYEHATIPRIRSVSRAATASNTDQYFQTAERKHIESTSSASLPKSRPVFDYRASGCCASAVAEAGRGFKLHCWTKHDACAEKRRSDRSLGEEE